MILKNEKGVQFLAQKLTKGQWKQKCVWVMHAGAILAQTMLTLLWRGAKPENFYKLRKVNFIGQSVI